MAAAMIAATILLGRRMNHGRLPPEEWEIGGAMWQPPSAHRATIDAG
jgi:hypothetical protein